MYKMYFVIYIYCVVASLAQISFFWYSIQVAMCNVLNLLRPVHKFNCFVIKQAVMEHLPDLVQVSICLAIKQFSMW